MIMMHQILLRLSLSTFIFPSPSFKLIAIKKLKLSLLQLKWQTDEKPLLWHLLTPTRLILLNTMTWKFKFS